MLNSNGGFNLYLGNNPSATGEFISVAKTPMGKEWNRVWRAEGEIRATNMMKNRAIEWIEANPKKFALLAVQKAYLFWDFQVAPKGISHSSLEIWGRRIRDIQYGALILLAVASAWFVFRAYPMSAFIWLGLMSYTGVHTLFYVIFRYRETIMPFVCVLAAMGLDIVLRNTGKFRA